MAQTTYEDYGDAIVFQTTVDKDTIVRQAFTSPPTFADQLLLLKNLSWKNAEQVKESAERSRTKPCDYVCPVSGAIMGGYEELKSGKPVLRRFYFDGNQTETWHYAENGTHVTKKVQRDGRGRPVRETTMNYKGGIQAETDFWPQTGQRKETREFFLEGEKKSQAAFDSAGRAVNRLEEGVCAITWNESGNRVSFRRMGPNGIEDMRQTDPQLSVSLANTGETFSKTARKITKNIIRNVRPNPTRYKAQVPAMVRVPG